MSRYLILAALLTGGTATVATAQTNQPATRAPQVETHLAPSDTTNRVKGIYVAPGMTGAPKQRVMTDYDNNPLPGVTNDQPAATTLSDKKRKRSTKSRP